MTLTFLLLRQDPHYRQVLFSLEFTIFLCPELGAAILPFFILFFGLPVMLSVTADLAALVVIIIKKVLSKSSHQDH